MFITMIAVIAITILIIGLILESKDTIFVAIASAIGFIVYFILKNEYILDGMSIFLIIYLAITLVRVRRHVDLINTRNLTSRLAGEEVFYIVDRKNRVKDISANLITKLGVTRDDALGRDIVELITKQSRIIMFNNSEFSNTKYKSMYQDYSKNVQLQNTDIIDLAFINKKEEHIYLKLSERPSRTFGIYFGRAASGRMVESQSEMILEAKSNDLERQLSKLRDRFANTFKVTHDGLYYADLTNLSVWMSDSFKNQVKLSSNTVTYMKYRELIHKEDLIKYDQVLGALTDKNNTYNFKYRINVNGKYEWIREQGVLVYDRGEKSLLIANANLIVAGINKNHHYVSVAHLPKVTDFYNDANLLMQNRKGFTALAIDMVNIGAIETSYGSDVKDFIVSDYIRKLGGLFSSTKSNVYNIGPTRFILLIEEKSKVDLLDRTVKSNDEVLNINMDYGSISVTTQVKAGIVSAPKDGKTAKELLDNAIYALQIASTKEFKRNYCYYGEIA